MRAHRASTTWQASFYITALFLGPLSALTLVQEDGNWWPLDNEDAHPGQGLARPGRSLQSVTSVKGLPKHFSIRPIVDNSLCVHLVHLDASSANPGLTVKQQAAAAATAALVAAARQRSGLPPIQIHDVQEYGTSRLVLLPCVGGTTDTFTAEAILGRFYFNNGTNYRQGFLKPSSDSGLCAYGVNATYTAGHPVFGVTGTEYYTDHPSQTRGAAVDDPAYDNHMDWFDEYIFDWAPYTRYGYDPATIPSSGFKAVNPLPPTMLDASGWGPFHSSWGVCMSNPTADAAAPSDDMGTEVALRYHSWIFVNVQDAGSVSHLPRAAARQAYSLLTLGPDRPQPDMSPLAGEADAGDLSAAMGGSDKPYGTGYSTLVSNELCMRLEAVKEGAQVRLAQCNPVAPALDQVFQLFAAKKPAAKKRAAAAKAAAKAAAASS
ncbi:hypothetical protein HYH02_002435 [Chlamydomonas schloesseri]|uniref:Uncharacterized protein n=1 Tax=Chlamydomonas schloesseri TaxID=2026947 RepID=A0A835WS14_9CHLO|nr:hypothetical protein HYH02_002435 [Chlamydomonas schloesseri]|eukprot:KAG2453104.1 hypothetical protein HYH02_002435 [Chlamydomonas schloesseri]